MATYFKPEYNEYYENLSTPHNLNIASKSIEATIEEVKSEYNAVYGLISELQGEFTGELYGSIEGLKYELESSSYVLAMLDSVVGVMEDLGGSVVSLHDEDPKYEDKQSEYNREMKSAPTPQYAAGIKTEAYIKWEYNLGVVKDALEKLITICEELQQTCDEDIQLIDDFNNAVVDLRLKLVAFVVSNGDTKIADINSMTLEQKEEYLEGLIEKLKNNYKLYKETYENALKTMADYSPEAYSAMALLLQRLDPALGVDVLLDFDGAFNGDNMVERGFHLISFLEAMCNNKVEGTDITYMDCITSYLSGEKSFEESGMCKLVEKSSFFSTDIDTYNYYLDNNQITHEQYVQALEQAFNSRLVNNVTYTDLNDPNVRSSVLGLLGVMNETKDIFSNNYSQYLNVGTMIKGTAKLKESLFFDDIRANDPDYKAYEYDIAFDSLNDWAEESQRICAENPNLNGNINEVYEMLYRDYTGDVPLTANEKKMLGYLLSSGKYDEAINYKSLIDSGINIREGRVRAEEKYQDILNGGELFDGQGFDDFRAFLQGSGKAGYSYVDGLVNLVDPDSEPSINDYYYMELAKLLKQDTFQIEGMGNTRLTASQANDYVVEQGFNPLQPDEITLSQRTQFNVWGTTWSDDTTSISLKKTNETVWVDLSGNKVDVSSLSGYTYNSERNAYISDDGSSVITALPTYSDSKGNVFTLAEWQSKGFDTVTDRTYGMGDSAISISSDRFYADSLNNSFNAGNSMTKASIKFIEDKFCPGLGTLTYAASDLGNSVEGSMKKLEMAYMDLSDGSNIYDGSNTALNSFVDYISQPGNFLSVAGDGLSGLGKIGGFIDTGLNYEYYLCLDGEKVGVPVDAWFTYCKDVSNWMGKINTAYGFVDSVSGTLNGNWSGAEKIYSSLTGKKAPLTYGTAWKMFMDIL